MERSNCECRCLLVEDNSCAAEIMAKFLENNCLFCDLAENGQIGLEKYLESPSLYDLIVVDIQMPVMDGYEMAKKIRESGSENAESIPIIAMSGDSADNQEGLRYMNRFVKKPFDLPALLKVLIEELGI